MCMLRRLTTLGLCALTALAEGQVPSQASPTGKVTGHVICTDTHLPAKFAQVMLLGVPSRDAAKASAALATAVGPERAGMSEMNMVRTQSGLDGSYLIDKIPPGDYYVFPWAAGYRQPFGAVRARLQEHPESFDNLDGVAKVHVTENSTSDVELPLQRGGIVAGKVTWNDRTPVAGASVILEPVKNNAQPIPTPFLLLNNSSMGAGFQLLTDDLGRYRVAGVSPGDYLIKVSFLPRAQVGIAGGVIDTVQRKSADVLVVYAPDVLYKEKASPVTVADGEEHQDMDITFDLEGLHTIHGQIESSEDHHLLNAGLVVLEDQAHKDFRRSASVAADGSFTLEFVPQGSYGLTVSSASDNISGSNINVGLLSFASEHVATHYKETHEILSVVDSDLMLPPVEVTPSLVRRASQVP